MRMSLSLKEKDVIFKNFHELSLLINLCDDIEFLKNHLTVDEIDKITEISSVLYEKAEGISLLLLNRKSKLFYCEFQSYLLRQSERYRSLYEKMSNASDCKNVEGAPISQSNVLGALLHLECSQLIEEWKENTKQKEVNHFLSFQSILDINGMTMEMKHLHEKIKALEEEIRCSQELCVKQMEILADVNTLPDQVCRLTQHPQTILQEERENCNKPTSVGIYSWNAFKMKKNMSEWRNMVQDIKSARLNLPFAVGEINLYLQRRDNHLILFGRHHENSNGLIWWMKFNMNIEVLSITGVELSWTQQQNALFENMNQQDGTQLMEFRDIPWNDLSVISGPIFTFKLDRKEPFDSNGLPAASLRENEMYLINWNELKAKYNYQWEWNAILENQMNSSLHFPFLSLASAKNNRVTKLYLTLSRMVNKFVLSGEYVESQARSPLRLALKMRLTLKNKNGVEFYWIQQEYVTFKKETFVLMTFNDIPWSDLSPDCAPHAEIVFHRGPTYNWNGLAAVTLPLQDILPIDWNILKSNRNYQFEWEEMFRDGEGVQLHFPPLLLPFPHRSTTRIILFFERIGDHFILYGGQDNRTESQAIPLKLSLKIGLTMSNKNGAEIHWHQHRRVTIDSHCNIGRRAVMKFKSIPWNEISMTSAPRTRITFQQDDIHNFKGLERVSLPWNESYAIDWNILKSKKNYQSEWTHFLLNREDASLDFPPLMLPLRMKDSSVIFYLAKRDSHLILHGDYNDSVTDHVAPVIITLCLNLMITNKNGVDLIWNQTDTLTFENRNERQWLPLMQFRDIPWTDMSSKNAPRAQLMLHETNPCTFFGLTAVPLSISESYLVDWNVLKSKFNYHFEWQEMIQDDEYARLHFPPLSLSLDSERKVVLNFYFAREPDFILCGTYSEIIGDVDISLFSALCQVNLILTKMNGDDFVQCRYNCLQGKVRAELFSLMEFPDIPWSELSSEIAPRAQLTFHNI